MSLAFDDLTRSAILAVRTVRQDATRAELAMTGRFDADAAAILSLTVDGHRRAGRRYLRVNLGAVAAIDQDAIAALTGLHHRLLADRGTIILTCISPALERRLAAADPTFFLLGRTAADDRALR
jgi:anti-anti-sigma regulatory factor